ncbi:MAG: tellurite resistance TerB family protein [Deltaproteobacteria bacterium]|nr:tellurite resistance TerB family protein [Deltaproteobacteria bacterium]
MNPLAAPYLYGLDEPLDAKLVDAYVTTLVCVAKANGIVESESRIIQGAADILGAMPFTVSRALATVDANMDDALGKLKAHPRLVALVYRDALLVARADGVTTAEENVALMQMATQLGLTAEQRTSAEEAADLLGQVRQKMIHI